MGWFKQGSKWVGIGLGVVTGAAGVAFLVLLGGVASGGVSPEQVADGAQTVRDKYTWALSILGGGAGLTYARFAVRALFVTVIGAITESVKASMTNPGSGAPASGN